MTTGGPGWETADSPPGTTAVRKVTVRGDGSTDTTKITTYGDGQVIDGHTLTITTADGVRTLVCDFDRTLDITARVGPTLRAKGHTAIVDDGKKITWRMTFTGTDGNETDQSGSTVLNPDGSGTQKIDTSFAVDGSGQTDEITWKVTTNAACHTEKFDTNGNTISSHDGVLASIEGGAWVDTTTPPDVRDDGAAQDVAPPPYGPRGPVIGGDLIDQPSSA